MNIMRLMTCIKQQYHLTNTIFCLVKVQTHTPLVSSVKNQSKLYGSYYEALRRKQKDEVGMKFHFISVYLINTCSSTSRVSGHQVLVSLCS